MLGCLSLASDVCCQVEISASGRSLVQRSLTSVLCVCVCVCGGVGDVCVSLSVIGRNNNPLHLESVGRREQGEKIRKKERKKTMEMLASKDH